jgi:hypothetical protein
VVDRKQLQILGLLKLVEVEDEEFMVWDKGRSLVA